MTDFYNEIHGIIDEITYHNPANQYTVLTILSEDEQITAVGMLNDAVAGEEVILTGEWKAHSTYGRQFAFSKAQRVLPDTSAKIFRYLSGGAIKGVGPKLAAKITDEFGDDTFEVIENHPERLARINGISAKKALEISASFKKQYAMRRILIDLESLGITPAECTAIYKLFGANSVKIIKENPYILCDTIGGFNFERTEKLTEMLEIKPESVFRNSAGILHILKHNTYNGHTCLPSEKLIPTAVALLSADEEIVSATIDAMIASNRIIADCIQGKEFLFLPEMYVSEKNISSKIKFFMSYPPSFVKITEDDIAILEERNNIKYEETQRVAIQTAIEKGILILTGGPGTGKTTIIKGIIDYLKDKGLEVLLAAPTGRAAKRLFDVTGYEAKTIHRLLEVEFDENDKHYFARNAENPLRAGAVIIDEMSMVDTVLCSALLDAVPIGCRIIMVGDSDQLPSVGPGNVLNDIINSGVAPVVCLTEIFRQAQESLIVMNSHALMEEKELRLHEKGKENDFFLIQRDTPEKTSQLISNLVSGILTEKFNFLTTDDIQILCPSRKGECGTERLNVILQSVLNPHVKSKAEIKSSFGKVFREGDRIMQTRNNYNIEWTKDKEEGTGIFNGDIGKIEKINVAAGYMLINFDGKITEYSIENLQELELAYATTIHKSQGNEYPAVIIPVIDCPSMLMYRNLLYTGITRAKKLLILAGSEEKVLYMASNKKHNMRYSALKSFLSE